MRDDSEIKLMFKTNWLPQRILLVISIHRGREVGLQGHPRIETAGSHQVSVTFQEEVLFRVQTRPSSI